MNITKVTYKITVSTDNGDYNYTGDILRVTSTLRKHGAEKGFNMTVRRVS